MSNTELIAQAREALADAPSYIASDVIRPWARRVEALLPSLIAALEAQQSGGDGVDEAAFLARMESNVNARNSIRPAQQAGGEPVAWRWKNGRGEVVTKWVDFHAGEDAAVRKQVAKAGGTMEYAYTHPAPVQQVDAPSDEQIDAALQAAHMYSTPESRKDMRNALRAALATQQAVERVAPPTLGVVSICPVRDAACCEVPTSLRCLNCGITATSGKETLK